MRFWVEAETGCFRACLFKCKWAAAAPRPLFQNRAVPLQLGAAKNICYGSDYHVYRAEIMHFMN